MTGSDGKGLVVTAQGLPQGLGEVMVQVQGGAGEKQKRTDSRDD